MTCSIRALLEHPNSWLQQHSLPLCVVLSCFLQPKPIDPVVLLHLHPPSHPGCSDPVRAPAGAAFSGLK